jgi:oligo-1,6-glucosidase
VEERLSAADWWKAAVVYQIYPRSFADSDGDGIGDLEGIISRLDHLAALGVDVLWLSPVYPSPQDDNGYDISDYQAIDPVYGDLATFDRLLAGAHARGIRLVMDLVVNHTSDEHPWFAESRSSTDNPKRDWYWWRPPKDGLPPGTPGAEPAGAEPNNWVSFFSGSAWQLDEATGEYYLHLFSRKQPDLNWENPQVREAVYAMMRWWLDRGVDGFRMDVINMISKPPELPDGPVPAGRKHADPLPFLTSGPRLHDYLAEMRREVFAGREGRFLTVGEMPGVTLEEGLRFTDPANGEVDMVFQFEHVQLDAGDGGKWDLRPLDLRDLKASLGRWQVGMGDVGWNSLYWNNHDQPRAVSRYGDDGRYRMESAKALGTVLHLHRGTPYVYQGEELGMTNAPFATIADFRDIESLNHHAVVTAAVVTAAVADGGAAHGDAEQVLIALRTRGRDNARTPCSGTPGRVPGSAPGRRGSA